MASVQTQRATLNHASAAPFVVRLREPCGNDELTVDGVDTRSAVQLLDRLMTPALASGLSASDRDGLLATLHRTLWGDRIVSSLRCSACHADYDLSFTLSALQHSVWQDAAPVQIDAPRHLRDEQGMSWHLPDAAAEEAAALQGPQAGREALMALATHHDTQRPDMALALERMAPLLDVDLDAPCAECGHIQHARFDIQTFVLQRLLDERDTVLGDVHSLALHFGWSLTEILSLNRSLRRSLVQRLATPGLA